MDKRINAANLVNNLQELPHGVPVVDSFTSDHDKQELMYAALMKARQLFAEGDNETAILAGQYAAGIMNEFNDRDNADFYTRNKRQYGATLLFVGDEKPAVEIKHQEQEPVEPVNPTFYDRVKNVFGRTKESLKSLNRQTVIGLKTRAIEFFDNEENGSKHRKILGGAIGAVAVVGVAAIAVKSGVHFGINGNHGNKLAQLSNHTNTNSQAVTSVTSQAAGVNVAGQHAVEAIKQLHQHLDHVGDNIWNHAQHTLQLHGNLHPSTAQIANETNRILTLNGISPQQAHFLPVGYDFIV